MASLLAPVARHAQADPDSPALRGPTRKLTYRELLDAALAYGGMLVDRGVQRGDSVLFTAPTLPEFVVGYLGIAAAGAVVVPVNPLCRPDEIEYFLADADCVLGIAWPGVDEATRTACATSGVDYLPLDVDAVDRSTTLDAYVEVDESDVACIIYTSGTTGRPKGAELTVGNLTAAARIATRLSQAAKDDALGTGLPLFHVFGQASVMFAALEAGCRLTLVPRFTAASMIDAIVGDRLSIVCGVPTMWNALLHYDGDVPSDAFANLRLAISGGATLPEEINRAFRTRFGCEIAEGYGLTETAALAAFARPGVAVPIGSVGPVVFECEIAVSGADGEHLPAGERGEVLVRGPVVMRGYRNRPEATASSIDADGWLHTGDIGEIDDDGNLRIIDRAKELIIRGGYNVYPSEVERVLYEHPDVVEAAVLGIPDQHLGEEVGAAIAVRPGAAAGPDQIREWVAERLAAYKLPRAVMIIDELPKGASGKILKRAIDTDGLVAALAEYRGARSSVGAAKGK